MLITPESGSHYYTRYGEPAYTVDYADGRPGKKTTVTDARKHKLVPSVTEVLKVYPKPMLDNWRMSRIATACAENPFNPDGKLTLKQWAGKIKEIAFKPGKVAADHGTDYHDVVEALVNDWQLPDYATDIPSEFFVGFSEWWEKQGLHVLDTENSFASHLGYGGRIDLIAEDDNNVIYYVDWKSKETKGKKHVDFYEDWPLQLEAYARGDMDHLGVDYPRYCIMSVVLSRDEPGRVASKTWIKNDEYWEAFLHTFGVWKYHKKYNPSWNV